MDQIYHKFSQSKLLNAYIEHEQQLRMMSEGGRQRVKNDAKKKRPELVDKDKGAK